MEIVFRKAFRILGLGEGKVGGHGGGGGTAIYGLYRYVLL